MGNTGQLCFSGFGLGWVPSKLSCASDLNQYSFLECTSVWKNSISGQSLLQQWFGDNFLDRGHWKFHSAGLVLVFSTNHSIDSKNDTILRRYLCISPPPLLRDDVIIDVYQISELPHLKIRNAIISLIRKIYVPTRGIWPVTKSCAITVQPIKP